MTANKPLKDRFNQNRIQKRKKRSKHDYHYWLADPFNSARGETSLWVAVITQAVMDALSKSRNPEIQKHKREAIYWLTENNKDFITVCLNAGMDPDRVRQQAKRAITSPTPWRAEPGKGKRYAERKAYREQIKKEQRKSENKSSSAKIIKLQAA